MPVDKPQIREAGLYYITITNHKWIPLFQIANSYDAVYKWFDHLKTKGHVITAYVIMPNHIHALIGFTSKEQSINTIIGNGKRFMAYNLVQRLKDRGHLNVLQELAKGVKPKDRSRGKKHEVFEPSFDIKECYNLPFINQKLDYIHNNPVTKKWALAVDPMGYEHSSARFYETGAQGVYPVTNFMELLDGDGNFTSG